MECLRQHQCNYPPNITHRRRRFGKTSLQNQTNMNTLEWSDFTKVEMRVGTVLEAEHFKEARKPAYKMQIDFGAYGIKKTSAQITQLYEAKDLIGKQVIAVVNFPPKQIANIMSECLVLGIYNEEGNVVLLQASKNIKNGEQVS